MDFKKVIARDKTTSVAAKGKYNGKDPNQVTSGIQKGKKRFSNPYQKFKLGERKMKHNAKFINSRR